MTGCPSRTRLVPVLEKFPSNVLRGVVVGVVFTVAFETAKLVAVAVVLVREPTVRVTTALPGVLWRDSLDGNPVLGGFVLSGLFGATERPLMECARVRDAFADAL